MTDQYMTRMDTLRFRETKGTGVSRLGRPYNETYTLSAVSIWTVGDPWWLRRERNNSLRVLQEIFCHYGIEKDEMG